MTSTLKAGGDGGRGHFLRLIFIWKVTHFVANQEKEVMLL